MSASSRIHTQLSRLPAVSLCARLHVPQAPYAAMSDS